MKGHIITLYIVIVFKDQLYNSIPNVGVLILSPQLLPQMLPQQQVLSAHQLENAAATQQSQVVKIGGKIHMQNAGPTFVLLQLGANLTAVSCNSPFSQLVQCPNCHQSLATAMGTTL